MGFRVMAWVRMRREVQPTRGRGRWVIVAVLRDAFRVRAFMLLRGGMMLLVFVYDAIVGNAFAQVFVFSMTSSNMISPPPPLHPTPHPHPMPSPTPIRPAYTPAQLTAYFTHISLPHITRDIAFSGPKLHANPTNALKFLTELQKYQLAAVPFENLSLHYSQWHGVSLDAGVLFGKIVGEGDGREEGKEGKSYRGGYCMENNAFFGTVLRSLGFEVYSAGARVHEGGTYLPW